MSGFRQRTAALIQQAGYAADHPIVIGVQHHGTPPTFLAHGTTQAGEPLTASTPVYAASLAKQITAACAAVLVFQRRLDMESTLEHWIPELPAWAHTIQLRHLVHHTCGCRQCRPRWSRPV
jgi:CubicO group peptidase (beta-lactamase class C family)